MWPYLIAFLRALVLSGGWAWRVAAVLLVAGQEAIQRVDRLPDHMQRWAEPIADSVPTENGGWLAAVLMLCVLSHRVATIEIKPIEIKRVDIKRGDRGFEVSVVLGNCSGRNLRDVLCRISYLENEVQGRRAQTPEIVLRTLQRHLDGRPRETSRFSLDAYDERSVYIGRIDSITDVLLIEHENGTIEEYVYEYLGVRVVGAGLPVECKIYIVRSGHEVWGTPIRDRIDEQVIKSLGSTLLDTPRHLAE